MLATMEEVIVGVSFSETSKACNACFFEGSEIDNASVVDSPGNEDGGLKSKE